MSKRVSVATAVALALSLAGCTAGPNVSSARTDTPPQPVQSAHETSCPGVGEWTLTGMNRGGLSTAELLDAIAGADVILLGERHDRIDDHRWQLHTVAALLGKSSNIAVGFEMFSRPQQALLDRWVAGDYSDEAFLEAVNWTENWGFEANLYLPLLHFVRMHRVPAVALNIERALLQRISRDGWDAVPLSERYQIQAAAPGPAAYDALLDDVMARHHSGDAEDIPEERKVAFRRAQGAWDRAMAEALADTVRSGRSPVVGIVGRGHMQFGYGIPYQLQDLGIDNVVTLLPYDYGQPCEELDVPMADGLFGLPPKRTGH